MAPALPPSAIRRSSGSIGGAPTTLRDPLGSQTVLKRGDPANPALVTRIQTPDGRVLGAAYDSPRARLVWVADSTFEGTGTTQTVTTSFVYGQGTAPDSPTEIRTPVDTSRFVYDTTLGLTDSVIAPEDPGRSSRTSLVERSADCFKL